MTTSTSCNRHANDTNDTIFLVEAGLSPSLTPSAALYYPSLIGNCWDDELLPSGD